MAGATKTTLATAIKTTFEPGMQKTFYEGTPLLNLFPRRSNTGGNSVDWKINYAGNAGATYDEGDTPPAAGNQSYVDATVGHQHFWNVVQITGHAKDALANGYFDGVRMEMEGGVSGLLHKIEETFISTLEGAINDDTSYAGLTRATYGLASDVTAGGTAALTLAMLSEMYETLKLDPRGVMYNNPKEWMIMSNPVQETAYTEVATGTIVTGDAESAGANLPYNTSQNDPSLDAGLLKHTIEYNKIPWFSIPTMTNSYVFLTRRSDILIEEARPLTIEPLGKIDDSDRFLLTWAGQIVHLDPYRAGRIEALTT